VHKVQKIQEWKTLSPKINKNILDEMGLLFERIRIKMGEFHIELISTDFH